MQEIIEYNWLTYLYHAINMSYSGLGTAILLMVIAIGLVKRFRTAFMKQIVADASFLLAITAVCYVLVFLIDQWIIWYYGSIDQLGYANKMSGRYEALYWTMIGSNMLLPILLFIKKLRRNIWFPLLIVFLINSGNWFEKWVILLTSFHRDFLPSSFSYFKPQLIQGLITIGWVLGILLIIGIARRITKQ